MPTDAEQWAKRRAKELLPCNCGTDGDGDWDPHLDRCQAEIRPAVAAELARLAEQVEQARAERDAILSAHDKALQGAGESQLRCPVCEAVEEVRRKGLSDGKNSEHQG